MCFKFLLSVPIHRFYPWLHINITWGAFKNSGFPIGPWTKYIMILDPQILRSQHFLKRFQCSNGWKSLLYLICFLWFKFSCRVSLMRLVLLRCLVIYQIIPICSSLPFQVFGSFRLWNLSEGRALKLQLALSLLKVFSDSGRRVGLSINRSVSAL